MTMLHGDSMACDMAQFLSGHGIKPSVQRLQIYMYLHIYKNHPTVEMIFLALNPQMPTLSKTTIYNTMKLFVDHNIIQSVPIEDEAVRYDADISPHAHFKCTACERVFDISIEGEKKDIVLPIGFQKSHEHIFIWGVCKDCNMKRYYASK